MKGYQIIEPKALHPLFSKAIYDAFAVAIMAWLCELLRFEFKDHLQHVEFDVICVTYTVSYPAIGIHYKDPNYQDIGPQVEAAVDRLLQDKATVELASFISKDQTDWKEVATRILSRIA